MKKIIVFISLILMSSTTLASSSGMHLATASCKNKDGSVFSLQRTQSNSYSLTFSAVAKVFGEGYYRLDDVKVANNLSCLLSSSDIVCESIEEVKVDKPKAGRFNTVQKRKHIFKVGSQWDNLISLQTRETNPNTHLGLHASFSIELPLGEVLVKTTTSGKNTKSGEIETFDVDISNLTINLQGGEAGCTARIE
ncbi:hypothetical protein D3C87_571920 [compost metagenome]